MTATIPIFRARVVVGLVVLALSVIGTGRVASAHTDFDSSTPADGEVVDAPVTRIVVNFTKPARPAGAGFELLDPTGTIRTPSEVDETDGTSFVLSFDPPLDAGTYGLRWRVRAGDAHPIDGSFRFEVTGSAPGTDAKSAPPSSVDASVPKADTQGEMDMDTAAHESMVDETGVDETGVDETGQDETGPDETGPVGTTQSGSSSSGTLDEFLSAGSEDRDGAAVGRVGRAVTILGTTFGIGVVAALVWTIRGRRDELEAQLAWVRLSGLALLTGGFLELAALTDTDRSVGITALLGTEPGVATTLKMLGGLAVLIGFHQGAGRIVAPTRPLSAAVATRLAPDPEAVDGRSAQPEEHEQRWSPTRSSGIGLAGLGLALVAFWFDGHTVTMGPWALHAIANLVHVVAAAVWGGGIFAMTTIVWMRHRRDQRTDLAAMVVRFSSTAALALAAVTVAGLLMTWMVLDSPGDVTGTRWGQTLIAKVAVVSVAAGLGGYNHFRLRPRLEQRPGDPVLAKELRTTLSIESFVFLVVIGLTAVLVAAAI